MILSIIAVCISGISLSFSIYTSIQHKRDEHRGDLRQFLVDSAHTVDRLDSVLYRSLSRPIQPTVNEELQEVLDDLGKVAVQEERWQGEAFDASFAVLRQRARSLDPALNEYARGMVDDTELVATMSDTRAAARAYAATAKEHLRRV